MAAGEPVTRAASSTRPCTTSTRFITLALHDLGYLPFEEPFRKLRLHN